MMNTIEFNKNYTKLPAGIKTARLVACEAIDPINQMSSFLKYDTEHNINGVNECAALNLKYNYLLLCLISDTGAFFTTLRKDNAENREKYMIWQNEWHTRMPTEPTFSPVPYQIANYGKKFQIIIKEG